MDFFIIILNCAIAGPKHRKKQKKVEEKIDPCIALKKKINPIVMTKTFELRCDENRRPKILVDGNGDIIIFNWDIKNEHITKVFFTKDGVSIHYLNNGLPYKVVDKNGANYSISQFKARNRYLFDLESVRKYCLSNCNPSPHKQPQKSPPSHGSSKAN